MSGERIKPRAEGGEESFVVVIWLRSKAAADFGTESGGFLEPVWDGWHLFPIT